MNQPLSSDPIVESVADHARTELDPLVSRIDQEGLYPRAYLRELGALGGFGAASPAWPQRQGFDLARQIEVTARVGSVCGATSFLVWCQSTCAWYLHHAANQAARERYFGPVSRGDRMAGTGMSNAVKHFAGLEKIRLHARRDGDGYVVDGILPWVSNVATGHLVFVTAAVENEGYVMLAVEGDDPGLELHPCPPFSGMEGTQTLNLRFKGVRVDGSGVLAHPAQYGAFLRRIKAGFVLNQCGIGFGVTEGSLRVIRESNISHAEVNAFLAPSDAESDPAAELVRLRTQADALTRQATTTTAGLLTVLKLRARTSELTLETANAAVLHAGAKGYLMRHPAQRRLREAVFVAIVTPALKHLRKEIRDLEQVGEVAGAV